MKVTVRKRKQGSGGYEVDIHTTTPDGKRIRKRMKSPVSSRSGSQRWGEERARHLALHGDTRPSTPRGGAAKAGPSRYETRW